MNAIAINVAVTTDVARFVLHMLDVPQEHKASAEQAAKSTMEVLNHFKLLGGSFEQLGRTMDTLIFAEWMESPAAEVSDE